MNRQKVPIVAIVGRANVGKSSLFNLIIGSREAIVADEPGTTRDSITLRAEWQGKHFWLVDTAGLKSAEDDFEMTIQDQITQAADSADLILVTVEAGVAFSEEDRRVAKMALRTKKPVILVVNKADRAKKAQPEDFLGLGIKPVILTSVTQRNGIEELLDKVAETIPAATFQSDSNRIKVALLGRPNVGKSSLFNSLAKKQQALVADQAGTTRDVNRAIIRYNQREIELMDTAGIRRGGKIERGVEYFSVLRSLAAIEEADICLLVIDVNEPAAHLDQRIAGLIKEAGRGLILVVSKWDSAEKDAFTHDQLTPRIAHSFDFTPWAPLIFTSAITSQNVAKLFDLILQIDQNRHQQYKTTELNRWLRQVIDKHPPAGLKNRQPKLNYMVHEEGNPIPSFKIFGSHTKFLHWSYKRYLEKEFRSQWPLEGSALKFWFIEKHVDKKKLKA